MNKLFRHTDTGFDYNILFYGHREVYSGFNAIDILETEEIDGIDKITAMLYDDSAELLIQYYHIEYYDPNKIKEYVPPKHNGSTWHTIHAGAEDWSMRCEHTFIVKYPNIVLLKWLHDEGNEAVQKLVVRLVKKYKYPYENFEEPEQTWYMSMLLGASDVY